MIKYSASTNGFYIPSIHSSVPADAVEITTERHKELLNGQAQGKRIQPDAGGKPILADYPPQTAKEILLRLDRDTERYIYAKPDGSDRYRESKQRTFLKLESDLKEAKAAGDTSAQAKLDRLKEGWDWIKMVIGYHYQIRYQIEAGNLTIEWDFSQFEELDPNVTLGEIML